MKMEDNRKNKEAKSNMRLFGNRGPHPFQEVEKADDVGKTIRRLIDYLAGEKVMLLFLGIVVIGAVLCSVYAPSLQSRGIDLIAGRKYKKLPAILLILLVTYGILGILNILQGLFSMHVSQNMVKKMRNDLFHKVVNLPVKYIDSHSHGDIMSRMTNDVENISNAVAQSFSSLIAGVLTIIGTVTIMFYYCWQLALIACSTMILTVIVTKYISKKMRLFYRDRQQLLGKLNGTVEEMVVGYKSVVAYNQQEDTVDEFCKTSNELTRVSIIAEIFGGSMGPVMNGVQNIGFVFIAAFGGFFALHGIISIGVISAFLVYAKQFGRPISEIAQLYGQIQTAIAGAERVFALMVEPEEDKSGELDMIEMKGNISFQNVTFSYQAGVPVLQNFNLEVPSGHKVALVGATGSGKTTVVNLLMRFYELDAGRILIDGVDIKEIACDHLRKNTGIVLQDTVLFADTIRNNLIYSKEDATEKEIIEASETGNCYHMIQKLSHGYETMLSEGASNLSQGQRQLLAIARAFLSDPKILILDEATSSVDTRTEKHIQDAMVNLMKDRTSLIIAHRLSTIQDADTIVVLHKGQIVEMGGHDALLEQGGYYHNLYMTQFAGKGI